MIMKKDYPGEPFNIHIQSSINIIQEKNWLITTKKGKVKLPLSGGDGEQMIPIYVKNMTNYLVRFWNAQKVNDACNGSLVSRVVQ